MRMKKTDAMDALFSQVVSRIKPTKHEIAEERALVRRIAQRLRDAIPPEIGIELVGSVAKDTHLRGDRDIDIFLLFPKGCSHEDLVKKGLEYAKMAVKPGEKWAIGYAEHPYLKARIEGSSVEIVPCFKITDIAERASSADRSPMHTRYVLEFLDEKGIDEVRLLKAFLKRLGVYGAEVKVEGFSGYLCELLIIEAGSFKQLLEDAAGRWHMPALDPEGHYGHEKAVRAKFPDAPLVVIDPVDPNRNVAASVSASSLAKFILAARAFLKSPAESFFFGEKVKMPKSKAGALQRKWKARGTHVIALEFKPPKVVEDVLWPQLKKSAKVIATRLEEAGFRVLDSGYWTDEKTTCLLLFEFEHAELPRVQKVLGPEVRHAKGAENFAHSHRNALAGPWVEGNRLVALEPRRFFSAADFIAEIAKSPGKYGIPAHVAKMLPSRKLLTAGSLFSAKYLEFTKDYVEKKGLSLS